jgi:flavin-dependent dehydrogenase
VNPIADVVVAGAGPAGCATAIHLARRGHQVTVVDRAAFPRDKPCSEYLSPEAVRCLDALGVVADLERSGAQPLFGTTVFGPSGSAVTGRFDRTAVRPFRPAGLSISRLLLDHRLVQAAREAGATVLERCGVEELIYEGGAVAGVVVQDARGALKVLRARVTVGADGLRSVVARQLGRRRHGRPSRLAFVAHVGEVSGLDGVAEMHVSRTGYVGLNRIAPGIANVALVVPRRLAHAARGVPVKFFFDSLARFPGVAERVSASCLVRRVLVTGPFAAWSGRVVADGALLVGDAADFFDPFTGEGIYSALRGAELASETIGRVLDADGVVTAARLRPYLVARRAAFLGKWFVERLVGYGMLAPALFDRAIARLERRGLGDTFIGVTADYVPAREILNPWFLGRMIL